MFYHDGFWFLGRFLDRFFPFIFVILFFGIFASIIFSLVRRAGYNVQNGQSPRLTVPATVIGKRSDAVTSGHTQFNDVNTMNGHMVHNSTSTSYFVAFQFESGDRMEFPIRGEEFGVLKEGDNGKLTFQGRQFLAFERF